MKIFSGLGGLRT
jgi:hypothetical protein